MEYTTDAYFRRGELMLLKQADQLVKEGRYEDALKVISRARAADPENIYALAYEERVLTLLNGHRQRITGRGGTSLKEHDILPPVDQQIAELAAPREGPVCGDHLTEDMRAHVALMLSRAYELRNRGEFDSALDVVSRAFLIDSSSAELIRLERQLWKERTISMTRLRARQGNGHPTRAVPPESSGQEDRESLPGVVDIRTSHTMQEHTEPPDAGFQQAESLTADRAARIEQVNSETQRVAARATTDQVADLSPAAHRLPPLHLCEEAPRGIEHVSPLEPHGPSRGECIADRDTLRLGELLAEAEAFRQCRDYPRALNALAGAYTIAPENKEVRKLEMTIRREELLQNESG